MEAASACGTTWSITMRRRALDVFGASLEREDGRDLDAIQIHEEAAAIGAACRRILPEIGLASGRSRAWPRHEPRPCDAVLTPVQRRGPAASRPGSGNSSTDSNGTVAEYPFRRGRAASRHRRTARCCRPAGAWPASLSSIPRSLSRARPACQVFGAIHGDQPLGGLNSPFGDSATQAKRRFLAGPCPGPGAAAAATATSRRSESRRRRAATPALTDVAWTSCVYCMTIGTTRPRHQQQQHRHACGGTRCRAADHVVQLRSVAHVSHRHGDHDAHQRGRATPARPQPPGRSGRGSASVADSAMTMREPERLEQSGLKGDEDDLRDGRHGRPPSAPLRTEPAPRRTSSRAAESSTRARHAAESAASSRTRRCRRADASARRARR